MYAYIIPFEKSFSYIPLVYSLQEDQVFNVNIGSIVEVPLGKGIVLGVVFHIFSEFTAPYLIKNIHFIVSSRSIFSQKILEVIIQLARKQKIPLHQVFSLFFPAYLKKFYKKNFFLDIPDIQKNISSQKENILVVCENLENYLEKFSAKKGDLLIFPTDPWRKKMDQKMYRFSSEKERRILYENMIKWDFFSVDSYREWLFLPMEHVTRILYFEDSRSQVHHFYKKTLGYEDVLYTIGEIFQIPIQIVSTVPSIQTMYRFITEGNTIIYE